MVLGMGIVLTDLAFVTCEVIVVECLHFLLLGQKASSSHTRRPFTCSLCKKTFTRKDTCREHLKRIHFREVLHCQVCNMAFNSRQTMWFHRKKTGHQYEIVSSSLPDPEQAVDNNQS